MITIGRGRWLRFAPAVRVGLGRAARSTQSMGTFSNGG